ncbi:MAG: hypothetical protein LBU65_17395 [Planctomycetaceae bacterium]|jgi:hypothetical protein|nr:hypothetical protein [Planctomycetaceae bacterium]
MLKLTTHQIIQTMKRIDFISNDFQQFLDNLPKESLKVLLVQALEILKEKEYRYNDRIQKAIKKWYLLSSQDIEYSNILYDYAHEADLKYQQFVSKNDLNEEDKCFFREMCIWNGLAGLFQMDELDHSKVYSVLYDFSHGVADLNTFAHQLEDRTKTALYVSLPQSASFGRALFCR